MQVSVVILSSALVVGAAFLTVGDYSHYAPESSPAVRLSSLYSLDDGLSAGDVRSRLTQIGYPAAARVFDPALERDSASSARWIDVGEALFASGDRTRAEYCYLRAAALAPNDPATLLAVGVFYAVLHNPQRAIPYFAAILKLSDRSEDNVLIDNILVYYDALHIRDLNLVDEAIPNARSANAWLNHLMQGNDPAAVRDTWRWMHAKGFDDDADTVKVVRYLFTKKQYADAAEDWKAHFAPRNDGYPLQNRIFNGGFEFERTGGVFDWNFDGFVGVTAERDNIRVHEGRYSMRLDFTGNDNPNFYHFVQTVYLTPGRYRLEAFLRTAAITSAEGIRLRVRAFQTGAILAESEGLTGTNDWTPVNLSFAAPSGDPLVLVELARHPALRIDNQLTGRAWLDSVRLTPER